jgi:drug/metabolite transporter (DMT)-like permease
MILVASILILIWGTTWGAIRVGLRGIPPFTGVALRFGLASLILLAAAWGSGIPLGRARRERRLWVINALFTFSASYGIVYWCEQYVPSGLTAILFSIFPLFVALLAHFFLPGERLGGMALAGILLGCAGTALIFSEDLEHLGGPKTALASGVMLLSPLVSALANVAVKRWGAGIHPLSLTAVPMGMTGLLMGSVAWLTERRLPISFDATSLAALLYLSLFGSALAFTLYFWLLSHATATQVSLIVSSPWSRWGWGSCSCMSV